MPSARKAFGRGADRRPGARSPLRSVADSTEVYDPVADRRPAPRSRSSSGPRHRPARARRRTLDGHEPARVALLHRRAHVQRSAPCHSQRPPSFRLDVERRLDVAHHHLDAPVRRKLAPVRPALRPRIVPPRHREGDALSARVRDPKPMVGSILAARQRLRHRRDDGEMVTARLRRARFRLRGFRLRRFRLRWLRRPRRLRRLRCLDTQRVGTRRVVVESSHFDVPSAGSRIRRDAEVIARTAVVVFPFGGTAIAPGTVSQRYRFFP